MAIGMTNAIVSQSSKITVSWYFTDDVVGNWWVKKGTSSSTPILTYRTTRAGVYEKGGEIKMEPGQTYIVGLDGGGSRAFTGIRIDSSSGTTIQDTALGNNEYSFTMPPSASSLYTGSFEM